MTRVLVFGTFDFLHIGHLHMLQTAKKFGDELIACVAKDKTVKQLKGRRPIHDEQERKRLAEHLTIVDTAVLGDDALGSYQVLMRQKPDVIVLGYDQKELKKDLLAFLKKEALDIDIRIAGPYKPGARKSSVLKKALKI